MANKKNISVRLSSTDLRSLKHLSSRLKVKDSDLFRFSIRSSLQRLMPLMYGELKGAELLLALLDCGPEMIRYFQFDAHALSSIVNEDCEAEDRVSFDDVDLAILAIYNEEFLIPRLTDKIEIQHDKSAGELFAAYIKNKYLLTQTA